MDIPFELQHLEYVAEFGETFVSFPFTVTVMSIAYWMAAWFTVLRFLRQCDQESQVIRVQQLSSMSITTQELYTFIGN